MNKEWFVLIDGYHKGPFSLEELEDLYRQDKLAPETLIWREGNASWSEIRKVMARLERVRAQALAKETYKKPPAIPRDAKGFNPAKIPTAKVSAKAALRETPPPPPPKDDSTQRPPPIPLDVLLNPLGKGDVFNEHANKMRSLQARYKLIFTIFIIFSFFGVATWFVSHENKSNIQIKARGVMPIYVDRMQDAAQSPSAQPIVSLALAMDGKSVYAAINKADAMKVEMTLTPVDKRVMGVSDVEIKLIGEIENHLGEFTKIRFIKGSQFYPGEYNVKFKAVSNSKLLEKAKFLENISLFNSLNKTIEIETVSLLYSGTPREFEKKIIDYHERVLEEELAPLYAQLESLKTMQSLLNKMMEDYVLVLYKMKKGSEIKTFENNYIKEISPIIQSMMVEALEYNKAQKDKELTLSQQNLLNYYERLVLFGKNIGELASDIITDTQKLKILTEKDRSALRNKFEVRYKVIKDALAQKVNEHEGKIEIYKRKI